MSDELLSLTAEELEKQMDDLRVEIQKERSAADKHTFKMNQLSSKLHELNDRYEQITEVRNDDGDSWSIPT